MSSVAEGEPGATRRRKRPDVAARKQANKGTRISPVVMTMNKFKKAAAAQLPLKQVLKDANKAVAEAYLLANMHVLRMCQLELPLEPLDQSFFYKCLIACSIV